MQRPRRCRENQENVMYTCKIKNHCNLYIEIHSNSTRCVRMEAVNTVVSFGCHIHNPLLLVSSRP